MNLFIPEKRKGEEAMLHKMKSHKRILSIIMILVMATSLFTGCSMMKTVEKTEEDGQQGSQIEDAGNVGEKGGETQDAEDSNAMGRYVETSTDIGEYCVMPKGITRLSDGSIVIPDAYYGRVVSEDNGAGWSTETLEWQSEARKNEYTILDVAYGADGTAGMIYTVPKDNASDENEGEAGEEGAEDTSDSGDDDSTDDEATEKKCLVVKPDGTQISVQIEVSEEEGYPYKIWISDKGRVFITTFGDNIYEVNGEGIGEKFLTVEGRPEQIRFAGNFMVIDGSRFKNGVVIYDLEKGEYITDEVLSDFLKENYEERSYSTQDCFDVFFFGGEDGSLYMAGNKGLHRHVIGGSAIEQVVDGSLSSFNNPSNLIKGMTAVPDNEFLVLFSGNKLVRLTYNPDIPTVPNERLKVYSLKENDTMRQAVNFYQTANPEVYVEYEVGIESESSVTRDDALKKLNTRIMAGEGPDVMVLDNMPVDSYMEKNLLLDLSDCIDEQELYGNIVDAFRRDGKIYMIPCEIQLPLVMGKEKYISQMTDLKGIADAMETLRKDNPGKALLEIYSERGIMRMFSMVSSPSWKTEDGSLDKEALKEFLTQCKRIYDAELEGIPQEAIEEYNDRSTTYSSFYGGTRENSDYFRVANEISYLMEDRAVIMGTVYYPHGVCEQFSVNRVDGHEDDVMKPMEGMDKNVFIPKTLVGINASSAVIDRAKEMIKILLGAENQEELFYGLSIRKDALEKSFEVDEQFISEEGIFSSIGLSTGDGRSYNFKIYVMEPEQMETLKGWIEAAKTPYIEDTVIEEAVYAEGAGYIQGNESLEEAVSAIEQSIAIYMSE